MGVNPSQIQHPELIIGPLNCLLISGSCKISQNELLNHRFNYDGN